MSLRDGLLRFNEKPVLPRASTTNLTSKQSSSTSLTRNNVSLATLLVFAVSGCSALVMTDRRSMNASISIASQENRASVRVAAEYPEIQPALQSACIGLLVRIQKGFFVSHTLWKS
jgi:hypothetical protein